LDVIAQYSMLSRFNNYESFFNDFQRHNFQVGVSLQAPIYAGKSVSSRIERARIEEREAELRHLSRRSSLVVESHRLYQHVEEADGLFRLAKMELDYARQSLDVFLAEYDEGRIALDQLEHARAEESIAWEAYYEALHVLEKARLNVLRGSGELAAALN
jgi:outer membrane protein TolC